MEEKNKNLKNISFMIQRYLSDQKAANNLLKDGQLSDSAKLQYFRTWTPISNLPHAVPGLKELVGDDLQIIRDALFPSRHVQISEDGNFVRDGNISKFSKFRKRCLLYVDALPLDVTHAWVREVFEQFGKVDLITLLKYRDSGVFKGIAFVEFCKPTAANRAVIHFYKRYQKAVQDEVFGKDLPQPDLSQLEDHEKGFVEKNAEFQKFMIKHLQRPDALEKFQALIKKKGKKEEQEEDTEEEQLISFSEEDEKKVNSMLVMSYSSWSSFKDLSRRNKRTLALNKHADRKKKNTSEEKGSANGDSYLQIDPLPHSVIYLAMNEEYSGMRALEFKKAVRQADDTHALGAINIKRIESKQSVAYIRLFRAAEADAILQKLSKFGEVSVLSPKQRDEYVRELKEKRFKSERPRKNQFAKGPREGNAGFEETRQKSRNNFTKGLLVKIEATFPADEPSPRKLFRKKIEGLPVNQHIVYIDVPTKENLSTSEDLVVKICYLRFSDANSVTQFVEQPDADTLGKISILEGEEEQAYWDMVDFRRSRFSGRLRDKRRYAPRNGNHESHTENNA